MLDNGLKIYDCPGLVFPNISSCKEQLVLNGVLPIDQLRDFVSPVKLLLDLVSRHEIEQFYKIKISLDEERPDQKPTANEVLSEIASSKGFRTSVFGNPDESRAARIILKDFVNVRGLLLGQAIILLFTAAI